MQYMHDPGFDPSNGYGGGIGLKLWYNEFINVFECIGDGNSMEEKIAWVFLRSIKLIYMWDSGRGWIEPRLIDLFGHAVKAF